MRKPLPPALLTLGSAGRIRLAQALWAGIPVDFDGLRTYPDQLDELRRRVAEYDADPSTGIPWEAFRAELRLRFGA